MKFPRFSQWKQIFKVLKRGEKITLLVFFILAASSLVFLGTTLYLANTRQVPTLGGTFVEGIIGQPRFINPMYGETNDIDRALIDLVFSGLMTYDNTGAIVKDLAKDYTISDDGKTYTFTLQDNIVWHDGKALTADDVIFTVKTIQNSDYKSPLRANWIDVEAQKISQNSVAFRLKQPYNSFLENCTLKIIPEHIWKDISPENFILSLYNLQPVGSGPFQFSGLKQTNTGFIDSLTLQSNRRYYQHSSFISTITFKYFEQFQDLVALANKHEIDGFSVPSDKNGDDVAQIKQQKPYQPSFVTYSFSLPRYFAVFFNNQKTSLFSDKNIREAMVYSVNKQELIQNIASFTKGNVNQVDSPLLPDFFGYEKPLEILGFDIAKANALLDTSGFKADATGHRIKSISKTPAFQFKNYLNVGSKNNEVSLLQACLVKLDSKFADLLKNETNGTYGKDTETAVTEFQKKYLPDLKPTGETGASTRAKLNELCTPQSSNTQPLQFTLVTINQPQLVHVATLLKNYWQQIGVSVEINAVNSTDLKPIIKNRGYDALLYGETLGLEPDPYPFWYSSQKQDPGLNLSSYENKDVDKLLKDARQTSDKNQKAQDIRQLQALILGDTPALFLHNPDYMYWASSNVKGIDTTKIADPSKRFINIINWYIETKRVWK